MEPSKKSNKKWIIFGTIIASLALLIAIGPILVSKYMRAHPKVVRTELMIKVNGIIKQAENKTIFLEGDNGRYYVLFGNKTDALLKSLNSSASVFGNIYEPVEGEMIENNPVRMRINVVNFTLSNEPVNPERSAEVEKLKIKIENKAKTKKEIAQKLNTQPNFEFIKGIINKETRNATDIYMIKDEYGDSYILLGAKDSMLEKELLIIGRLTLPRDNYPIKQDELMFNILEVYDSEYNKVN
jgi:hypothetical protein